MRNNVMRIIFMVMVIACLASAEPWILNSDANLTLTQNAYSNNWAGDETGSVSWACNANFLAEKQLHTKINTRNTVKLAFGQTYYQDKDTKEWAEPIKSTDLIDIESLLRFTLQTFVDPFISLRVESQFQDKTDLANERYFDPMNFTESTGIARMVYKKEHSEWLIRLGAGLRQYLDRDARDTLTNQYENIFTNDGGLIFTSEFNTPLIRDKISYTNKLSLYKALYYSEADALAGQPNENYWKYPDANWEHMLTANITNYVMVNLYVEVLYDREIDQGMRFKETLSLGLTYKTME